jgi:hypothetical protein
MPCVVNVGWGALRFHCRSPQSAYLLIGPIVDISDIPDMLTVVSEEFDSNKTEVNK